MPTLDEFRNQSGDFAPEPEQVQDAAVQQTDDVVTTDTIDIEQEQVEQDTPEADTSLNDQKTPVQTQEQDDLPELSEKEKTAFEKRLERERRKLDEEKQKLREELEQQANPYKEVVDLLGGNVDQIKATIQQNQLISQADKLADQYGWTQPQYDAFIQQEQAKVREQQTQRELQELRIVNEINKLSRKPEFTGIDVMEKEIVDKVIKSNGALTAGEVFFALGGESRIKQMTRETEQRMVAQRAQKRVIQTDSAATPSNEKPIPQDMLTLGLARGMNEKQIRELLEFDATNIQEYRAKKKAK